VVFRQFTPSFERILYNYEAEAAQISAAAGAQQENASAVTAQAAATQAVITQAGSTAKLGAAVTEDKTRSQILAAAEGEEAEEFEPITRIETERLERRSAFWQRDNMPSVDVKTSNKSDVGRQTDANQALALFCVQNADEPGVWQELPDAPNAAATPYFEQFELYAMFTLDESGIIDIRVSATGFIQGHSQYFHLDYRAGKTATIQKRFVVDPALDTVTMRTEQSEPLDYPWDGGAYTVYDYPYLSVTRDADFTVVSDSGISLFEEKETLGAPAYERITVEEYRRAGDEFQGVVADFKYPSLPFFFYHYGKYHPEHGLYDKNYDKMATVTDNGIVVYTAKGSEQYVFSGNRNVNFIEDLGAGEWAQPQYGVFYANDAWEYCIESYAGTDGDGAAVYSVRGRVGLRAVNGIRAYHFLRYNSQAMSSFPIKIELADGIILEQLDGFYLDSPGEGVPDTDVWSGMNFFLFDSGRFYDDTWRIWGSLRFNRAYGENGDWSFSDAFHSVPFPAGVSYAEGVDFSKADQAEQIVKSAAVLGVENAYLNPERVFDKLNGLLTDELSFRAA